MDDKEFIPLLGGIASMGEYYLHVYFENHEGNIQRLRLQADTGSSSLIAIGENCRNCSSPTKRALKFNTSSVVSCSTSLCPATSCYHESSSCGFKLRYGDNTPQYNLQASGNVLELNIALMPNAAESHRVFAYVIQEQIGKWPSKVDGILGLAFEKLNCNPTCFPLAWKAFARQSRNEFQICLGDEGGALRFVSTKELGGNRIGLPLLDHGKSFFAVHVLGLALAVTPPHNSSSNKITEFALFSTEMTKHVAVVDSGTTLLIVPHQMFAHLVQYFQSHYCHLPGVCGSENIFHFGTCLRRNPYTLNERFPTLALVVNTHQILLIPPELYFVRYAKDVFCFAIQGGPEMILGDVLMRGFTVGFEPQQVWFSTERRRECGTVYGLENFSSTTSSLVLSSEGGFKLSLAPMWDETQEMVLTLLNILLVIGMVLLWRIGMRRCRRLGYDSL